MRVTPHMLQEAALKGMQTNLRRLAQLQQQAATTRRLNLPEDDPFAAEQALGFRARIDAGEALLEALTLTRDWLTATDKALSDAATLLTRAQNLALRGANESLGAEERVALGDEADALLEEALAIGNTRHGDQYLFSGFRIDTAPFAATRDPVTGRITATTYQGDNNLIMREVEPGMTMVVNVEGDSLFSGMFAELVALRDSLEAAPFDPTAVTAALTAIQNRQDTVGESQATIGARLRRLDTAVNGIEDAQIDLQALLSKTEDADMAEVLTQLAEQQFVYQSALAVNAQVLRLSLLDFMR